MNRMFTGLLAIVAIGSIIGNFLMYQRYSTSRPLVTVGNEVIRKKDYADQLDYQVGKPVLNRMVYASLVSQAAKKANLYPTDAEVQTRIDQIQRRNPQQLAAAEQDPAKMAELKRNLANDIALENLQIQNVKVTPAEVNDFYQANKNAFTLPVQAQTTLVVTGAPISNSAAAAQAASDASTAYSLLKQNINLDVIARQPRLMVAGMNNFKPNIDALPQAARKQISDTIFRAKKGEIKTIPIKNGPEQLYFTFRINKAESQRVQTLSEKEFHDQIERLVKLKKAPSAQEELAKLYGDFKPRFDVEKYAGYFSDVQSYNDNKSKASSTKGKTASSR